MSTPINSISQAELDGYSEQSMIEKLYIKSANDIIGGALTQLQRALLASSAILQTLAALQNAKNQVEIIERSVGSFPSDQDDYIEFASNTFGKPLVPTINSATFSASTISTLTNNLTQQLSALASIIGASAVAQQGGLYQLAMQVRNDILKSGPAGWVLDNYGTQQEGSANTEGNYQNNLSLAITSAQSLSATQKEQVRNYLFIFEEYYKSAGAMLSKISSLIERMAQNAGRSS